MNGQDAFDAILDKLDTAIRDIAGQRALADDARVRLNVAETERNRLGTEVVRLRERASMLETALKDKGADIATIERLAVTKRALEQTQPAPRVSVNPDIPF